MKGEKDYFNKSFKKRVKMHLFDNGIILNLNSYSKVLQLLKNLDFENILKLSFK